jgi:glycosyltransferase involved in cell wall biosynthesis
MYIVPVGIDTENIKTGSSYVQNTIYYIGALDWTPNQEGLLWFLENVWPHILKTCKNTILHIAGRNAPQWLIPKIAKHNVMFHGEVPNAYTFMQNAGIMIVPLLSGSGMRVKIIEGMAMGKAIVSTTIGAEGIDVENGKEILIADKPDDFAQKIISLLESAELSVFISKNARKCAIEKYDNKNISKKLSAFFTQSLNNN